MPKSRMRHASMAMCSATSLLSGSEFPLVKREARGESFHAASHFPNGVLARDVLQHLRDQRARFAHLRFAEAARRHGGRAQPDAARVQRRVHVEWNRILVYGDSRQIEGFFGLLAAQPLREDV